MKIGDRIRVVTDARRFATRVNLPVGATGTVVGVGEVNGEVSGVAVRFDHPPDISLSAVDVERLHPLEVLIEDSAPGDYPGGLEGGMTWRAITNRLHYFRPLPPGGHYAAQSLCQRAFLSTLPDAPEAPDHTVLICGACNLRAPETERKLPLDDQ